MGEAVTHVHFLIIPRMQAMAARGLAMVEEVCSGKWATTEQEAKAAAAKVRQEMRNVLAYSSAS